MSESPKAWHQVLFASVASSAVLLAIAVMALLASGLMAFTAWLWRMILA